MWLIFTFLHAFFMALVNYLDEYLTQFTTIDKNQSIHKKVWGLILVSTLFWIFTLVGISFFISDFSMTQKGLTLSLLSSIPMVFMFSSYFYLFQKFSAHQVVPLFWLSSIWLLFLEIYSGDSISLIPLLWILSLLYGAYILDTQSYTWKIPTSLLLIMLPVSFLWAISLFIAESVSRNDSILNFFFYQYVWIIIIWIILFLIIKPYREWLIERCKTQWKIFIWWSIVNESFAQISFLFSMIAVGIAPLATYVTAVSSTQYVMLFLLLFLFPIHERNTISKHQIISVLLMMAWILLIELF